MPIAQNILFQFIFIMNACIRVKQLFTRLSAIYETISHYINKCVKSIVIAPAINLVYFLYRLKVKFLSTGTTAVCISRYILKINPSEYDATITGSCNCNARKLITATGRELRGTSDEGRGTINFPQTCEVEDPAKTGSQRGNQISANQRNQGFKTSCTSGKSCQKSNQKIQLKTILFRQDNMINRKQLSL
ncbi:MAG: hypothetical protein JXA96_08400 [Sedimentisphaerales bacterium]|nr:hypothetical protein [Sedimentisphaerales bacterium]